MADTPWNSIDPLPAGKNQDIELLVKSNGANYREKAEQIMQAFSGLGTVDGSCTSAIDAEEKTVTLAEYTLNILPREFSVTFTNANTYGNGTTTYPILKVYNSNNELLGSLPAANSRGRYAGNGAWEAGDILYFRVMAGRACIINSEISTTRDLQARVKDMTLSALDLTEANKTLPVNSSAVDGALAKLTRVKIDTTQTDANSCFSKSYSSSFILKAGSANTPTGGNYIIQTYNQTSNNGYQKFIQLAFYVTSYDTNTTPTTYIRMGTETTLLGVFWGPWEKFTTEADVNNALAEYGKLKQVINPEELDTDKYKDNGYYSIGNTANRLNLPIQQVGTLLVYNAKFYIIQEYFLNSSNVVYFRKSLNGGTSWSSWEKITTETDLNNALTNYQTKGDYPNLMRTTLSANSSITITNGSATFGCMIIGQGTNSSAYFAFLYQGYSTGTSLRNHVLELQKGNSITYEIIDNTLVITNNTNTSIAVRLLPLINADNITIS